MVYYIFLKSLRSLEEFRKNPHVKIPPKSPSTNFQSLAKFKNPILIRRFFFLAFGPADLAARSAFGPAGPAGSSPLPQAEAHRPTQAAQPRAPLAYLQKYVFFFDSRLPSSAPSLSSLADAWTPLVSFFFSTATPAESPPRHRFPHRLLRVSGYR
jgi:hypothetical protein